MAFSRFIYNYLKRTPYASVCWPMDGAPPHAGYAGLDNRQCSPCSLEEEREDEGSHTEGRKDVDLVDQVLYRVPAWLILLLPSGFKSAGEQLAAMADAAPRSPARAPAHPPSRIPLWASGSSSAPASGR